MECVDCAGARGGGLRTCCYGEESEARVGAAVVGDYFQSCAGGGGGAGGEVGHLEGEGAVGFDVAFEVGGDGDFVEGEGEVDGGSGLGGYGDGGGAGAVWGGGPVYGYGGADGRGAGGVADCAFGGCDADVGGGGGDCEVCGSGTAGEDVDCAVFGGVWRDWEEAEGRIWSGRGTALDRDTDQS